MQQEYPLFYIRGAYGHQHFAYSRFPIIRSSIFVLRSAMLCLHVPASALVDMLLCQRGIDVDFRRSVKPPIRYCRYFAAVAGRLLYYAIIR